MLKVVSDIDRDRVEKATEYDIMDAHPKCSTCKSKVLIRINQVSLYHDTPIQNDLWICGNRKSPYANSIGHQIDVLTKKEINIDEDYCRYWKGQDS